MVHRYLDGIICVVTHKDFRVGVVEDVRVQCEVLLGRKME